MVFVSSLRTHFLTSFIVVARMIASKVAVSLWRVRNPLQCARADDVSGETGSLDTRLRVHQCPPT